MDNIILLGFLFAIVGLSVYLVMIYNGLVVVKNDIDKAWANIDVMLKQRHDELPHQGNAGYICGCVHEPETARDVQGGRSRQSRRSHLLRRDEVGRGHE